MSLVNLQYYLSHFGFNSNNYDTYWFVLKILQRVTQKGILFQVGGHFYKVKFMFVS